MGPREEQKPRLRAGVEHLATHSSSMRFLFLSFGAK